MKSLIDMISVVLMGFLFNPALWGLALLLLGAMWLDGRFD